MCRFWAVATAWLVGPLAVGGMFLIPRNVSAQDQPSLQEFVANYERLAMRARMNIPAANARVRSIWSELAVYSGHQFPVLPSEDFDAGRATASGIIFLDLSIAATPSAEVTRFFMAHEWGHLMHGDPIAQMSPIGQFNMMLAGDAPAMMAAQAEANADNYAATFMRYRGHDIKPVLEFLCSIPDTGTNDPHGTGLERAKHVAKIFGSPGHVPPVPCDPSVLSPEDRDNARVARIKSIVTAAGNEFRGILKNGNGDFYDATITLPGFNNHEVSGFCHVPSGDTTKDCDYRFDPTDQTDFGDILTALDQSISSAFPNWKTVDAGLRHGYKDKVWYFHDGSQTVELFVDEFEGRTFVSLRFVAAFNQ